ncbi:MAG: hypothetical protein KDA25_12935, partial [Phycisphaerales bacterium]|nr:hypothetical protein [Phycisphaerales bacterium]
GTAVGLLIGLGIVSALAWQGVIGGILMGFSIGSLLGLRRDPARGWRGGLRRPPRWLLVANGAITALIVFGVRFGDRESWLLACVLAILSQYVFPLVSFSLSAAAAEWFRPRIHVYRQLAGYLRVMWVPIGAFAVGYLCIILVFATLAAALYRYDQAAFSGTDFTGQRSVIDDFFRFAVYNVLAPDYNTVAPASGLAHLLVTLQLVFSFGWAVVVFAAVMTHVQPQLDRIARAVLPHHDDDGRDA